MNISSLYLRTLSVAGLVTCTVISCAGERVNHRNASTDHAVPVQTAERDGAYVVSSCSADGCATASPHEVPHRYPVGNICTMSRAQLEREGILPYSGPVIAIPIGEEFMLSAQVPTVQGQQDIPPPIETEVIDGVTYWIQYSSVAECKSKFAKRRFTFRGQPHSLELQESLYNMMCNLGPQIETVLPIHSNGKFPSKGPSFSVRQFWKVFLSRVCKDTVHKIYLDADGNQVQFGNVGMKEVPKN